MLVGAYDESSGSRGLNGDQSDNSAHDAGAAYHFAVLNNAWTFADYIKPLNTDAGDTFGYATAISGDTLMVSSREEDGNGSGFTGDPFNNSAHDAGAGFLFDFK